MEENIYNKKEKDETMNGFVSDGMVMNDELGNDSIAQFNSDGVGEGDCEVNSSIARFGSGGEINEEYETDGGFKGRLDSDSVYEGNLGKSNSKVDEAKRNENYNRYVNKVTPKNGCVGNCFRAFVTGGVICMLGQVLINVYMMFGIVKDDASLWATISLVAISVILTGFNIYPQITAWGGAGSLVPITGFANSVAAPAIEYKSEGEVFGIGCKIFTIAGPVILYGVVVSFVLGILYYLQIMLF